MEIKDRKMEKRYVDVMLENNLFAIIYPKDKSQESARKLTNYIDSAVGIAKVESDENNGNVWGVLIDKRKEAKKHIKILSEE